MKILKKIFSSVVTFAVIVSMIPVQTVMAVGAVVTTSDPVMDGTISVDLYGETSGGTFTDRGIEIGEDVSYGYAVSAGAGSGEFSVSIDLDGGCGETYHFRAYGVEEGEGTLYGDDNEFVLTCTYVTVVATDNVAAEIDNPYVFTFTRTGSTDSPLTVYFTRTGTAEFPADGCLSNGDNNYVTILAGQSSEILSSSGCMDDGLVEETETIIITVVGGDGYYYGNPNVATAYIYDGDTAPPRVTIEAIDDEAYESAVGGGSNNATFRIYRDYVSLSDLTSDLTVNFSLSGTADRYSIDSGDYLLSVQFETVTISSGDTYFDLTANSFITDDGDEGTETIIVTIEDGDGYVVGYPSTDTATLNDGEGPADEVGEDEDEDEDGSVVFDVVCEDGVCVATVDENVYLTPSGDSSIADVSIFDGTILTSDSSWNGTLSAAANEVNDPSEYGLDNGVVVSMTKGDYEGTLHLSYPAVLYFPYEGFSDLENPTVLIDGADDAILHCSDTQWTGTTIEINADSDNLHLDPDETCYIGADDVDDEEEDFVLIATRHFSDFVVGDGVATSSGNGGSSGGVYKKVVTKTDETLVDVAVPETIVVPETIAIKEITKQVVEVAKEVKIQQEVKLIEKQNVVKLEKKVEELFTLNLVNVDSNNADAKAVLESVREIFASNADADLDGIPNYKDANPMIKDVAVKNLFTQTEDSTVANLKVAAVSSNGFVLSGTTKPNSDVEIKIGKDTFKTTSDINGHYLIPVELANNIEGLFAVETTVNGVTSKVLIKSQKDTIPQPEFKLEGKQISTVEDFTADDLIAYVKKIENKWVRDVNVVALVSLKYSEYIDVVIARLDVRGTGETVIVKGKAVPGATVILAYKSVIYSSVVIADKNGNFEAEVPKDLAAELEADVALDSVEHQLIAFAVDYKTNKVSPFVRDLFKIYK